MDRFRQGFIVENRCLRPYIYDQLGLAPASQLGCTQLIDTPGPTFSCGVTRVFGGADKIWAQPVVGASQYRFRFQNPDEGFIRLIAKPTYFLVLNWTTLPLLPGTYDVDVEVNINGIWSGYCGAVCQVFIVDPAMVGGGTANRDLTTAGPSVQLWPNPVLDGIVYLNIDGLTDLEQRLTVDVYDLFGKRVAARDRSQ